MEGETSNQLFLRKLKDVLRGETSNSFEVATEVDCAKKII